ncbi:MAG TPA: heme-binding domain-containing protein [Bacteroidales bacterium]|nr:heme-binding domain-containing protein [Bacteroidales bacterium]
MRKYIVIIVILFVFGIIQFIRPERNLATVESRYDVFYLTETNPELVRLVKTACYDCHSDRTAYPWYASIAPVSWMIGQHVKDGKKHLDFSKWLVYDKEERLHHLREIKEVLQEAEMPPAIYLLMHSEAKLSGPDRSMIIQWADSLGAQIQLSLN